MSYIFITDSMALVIKMDCCAWQYYYLATPNETICRWRIRHLLR